MIQCSDLKVSFYSAGRQKLCSHEISASASTKDVSLWRRKLERRETRRNIFRRLAWQRSTVSFGGAAIVVRGLRF
jgi:hypothetical protein